MWKVRSLENVLTSVPFNDVKAPKTIGDSGATLSESSGPRVESLSTNSNSSESLSDESVRDIDVAGTSNIIVTGVIKSPSIKDLSNLDSIILYQNDGDTLDGGYSKAATVIDILAITGEAAATVASEVAALGPATATFNIAVTAGKLIDADRKVIISQRALDQEKQHVIAKWERGEVVDLTLYIEQDADFKFNLERRANLRDEVKLQAPVWFSNTLAGIGGAMGSLASGVVKTAGDYLGGIGGVATALGTLLSIPGIVKKLQEANEFKNKESILEILGSITVNNEQKNNLNDLLSEGDRIYYNDNLRNIVLPVLTNGATFVGGIGTAIASFSELGSTEEESMGAEVAVGICLGVGLFSAGVKVYEHIRKGGDEKFCEKLLENIRESKEVEEVLADYLSNRVGDSRKATTYLQKAIRHLEEATVAWEQISESFREKKKSSTAYKVLTKGEQDLESAPLLEEDEEQASTSEKSEPYIVDIDPEQKDKELYKQVQDLIQKAIKSINYAFMA